MLTLKLQYENFESGEFTDEIAVDKDALLKLFEEHTQINNPYHTISSARIKFFLSEGGHYLSAMHFSKDAFTVFYCNANDDKLYTGNFYKASVKTMLEYFALQNYNALNKLIPRTTSNKSELQKRFSNEDFTYRYKYRGLIWLLIHSVITIPLFYVMYQMGMKTSFGISFILLALPVSIYPVSVIMHLILNCNYVKKSKGKSLKISKGSSTVIFTDHENRVVFEKPDIEEIIIVEGSGPRNPFFLYNYTRIILKNREVCEIPFMILHSGLLILKLKDIPIKRKRVFYPFIRKYRP